MALYAAIPPVTPRTMRLPARGLTVCSVVALGGSGVGCSLRFGVGIDFDLGLRLGASVQMIFSSEISWKPIDSGLRAVDDTCGGIIPPRPSPSWLKYELMLRARRAANVTSVNLESTLSSKLSMGGLIIVSWSSAIVPPSLPACIGGRLRGRRAGRGAGISGGRRR